MESEQIGHYHYLYYRGRASSSITGSKGSYLHLKAN
jgi:hypothetical protein